MWVTINIVHANSPCTRVTPTPARETGLERSWGRKGYACYAISLRVRHRSKGCGAETFQLRGIRTCAHSHHCRITMRFYTLSRLRISIYCARSSVCWRNYATDYCWSGGNLLSVAQAVRRRLKFKAHADGQRAAENEAAYQHGHSWCSRSRGIGEVL
jgi:hypothetical protein